MRELWRLVNLSRFTLHACDGDIGSLQQIYFDDRDWKVRYFVVRTGNWLLGREVLVLPGMVTGVNGEERRVDADLTREQIENSPPIDTKLPVSRHYEEIYYRYYGLDPYWGDDPLFGPGHPPPDVGAMPREPPHPHLRSSEEVIGYAIGARDGEIGRVKDFVVEEPDWTIRYLEVATGVSLFGKDVLMACAWLEGVDWSAREVTTGLRCEAIESAPAYDASKLIDRDYQVALYKHYGMHFDQG